MFTDIRLNNNYDAFELIQRRKDKKKKTVTKETTSAHLEFTWGNPDETTPRKLHQYIWTSMGYS